MDDSVAIFCAATWGEGRGVVGGNDAMILCFCKLSCQLVKSECVMS